MLSWRILENGSLAILQERRWIVDDNSDYCVDGLSKVDDTWNLFSGDEDQQIVLRCPSELDMHYPAQYQLDVGSSNYLTTDSFFDNH